jgi:hypothetical protein
MGFLDKAKERAQGLAGQAKEMAKDVQARRKADDLLDDLGRILYLERTGRPMAGAESEIVRLVAELEKLEAVGVPITVKAEREPESESDSTDTPMPPPPPPAPGSGWQAPPPPQ